MESPEHYSDKKMMELLIEKEICGAEFNIIKYTYRWKKKDGLKDLYKARDYLNALIAWAELKSATPVSMVVPTINAAHNTKWPILKD